VGGTKSGGKKTEEIKGGSGTRLASGWSIPARRRKRKKRGEEGKRRGGRIGQTWIRIP
jgi:hypothetical protein